MGNVLQCPESNRAVTTRLMGFALLVSLMLIANPGFFTHTFFEQLDYVHRFGVAVNSGPLSKLLGGLVSIFAEQYPFWMHLLSALLHGAVASLLFAAIGRVGGNRNLAWAGSLLFLASPLVAFSTAWVGAYPELLCALFGLVAFNTAQDFAQKKRGNGVLATTLIASLLAVFFSKNAAVLPLLLLLVAYCFPSENTDSKRLWTALFVLATPVLLYLMFQLAGGNQGGAAASLGLMGGRLFVGFIYPFVPFLTESHTWMVHSSLSIGAAVAMHLALIVFLWRVFSVKAASVYLLAYLVLVLPSLFIGDAGAHSLYTAGIPFGLAFGALLAAHKEQTGKGIRIAVRLLLAVSLFHTFFIQHYFYKTGTCMNRITASVSSAWLADGKPDKMSIVVQPDAPAHVLLRFAKDRTSLAPGSKIEFEVVEWQKQNETKTGYQFDCDCQVYEHPDLRLNVAGWGPETVLVNTNPNPQPDGTMGTWIEVNGAEKLGNLEVLLDGKPAKLTSVQPTIITATFTPDNFLQAGEKEFAVRQVSTGKTYVVGRLRIEPGN